MTLRRRLVLVLLVVASAVVAPATAAAAAEELVVSADTSSFPDVVATIELPEQLVDVPLDDDAVTIREGGRVRKAVVTPLRSQAVPVVLVVDTSGSMRGAPLEGARAAATAFARKLPPAWPIAVVGFGSRPALLMPFTADRDAVANALASLRAAGETALYDAVALTGGYLHEQQATRATVVLLSDGGDTVSTVPMAQSLAGLPHGARMEIVELASPESDHAALVRLAEGRGSVTSVGDGAGLDSVYAGLARSLSSQYVARYTSVADEPATLEVTVRHGAAAFRGVARFTPPPLPPVDRPAAPAEDRPEPVTAGRAWFLVAGAVLAFVGLATLSAMLIVPRRRLASLEALAELRTGGRQSELLSDLAARAVSAAETALDQRGRRRRLNDALDEAGLALRAGELLVLVCSAVLACTVLFSLLAGPIVGVVAGACAGLGARLLVKVKVQRRRTAFSDQLPDVVQMLSGALRAGYALGQAIDSVAREAPSPAADELHRVVVESRLGRDLTESLRAAADRMGSQDFDWVVQAIEIQRDVGGDLAEVLDNVAHTIRERTQLHRHVRALTAEGRMSAYILLALPPFLALALSIINPEYMAELTRGAGLFMAVASLVLMGVGAVWFKALCRLQY